MNKIKNWYKSIPPRAQKVVWDIAIAILAPIFFLIVSLPALLYQRQMAAYTGDTASVVLCVVISKIKAATRI